ncbi:MAG: hypothetical protein KAY22_00720 [Rhizorhabdus sp.]|jgi:hypothetical protein|uniref:hypothetical protein n=1 Tax=Rhizorhabdus sp. TaxID=1968843 RepID=UPI001B7A6DB4|nr:hypothetical protein [Rhizorhabdus sp.]MBP8230807.1 hypothetical protein [Rhizorhabdus sp.]
MTDTVGRMPERDNQAPLRPWHPPVLKVEHVDEITRSGSTSSRNDGSSIFAPTS